MKSRSLVCMLISMTGIFLREVELSTAAEEGLGTIHLTCVDPSATGYGTFQSHNQKVVANKRGYFMTHIRTRNAEYTAQQWRLSWSRDEGESFTTLYEATHATNPPVLETDDEDNLYLIRADFVDGNSYLYRFLARNEYHDPEITPIPQGAAGKFCAIIDLARKQLYYFAHNNRFYRLALDGTVKSSTEFIRPGQSAILQYPLLYLDSSGILHAAWTTQQHGVYMYWDIHYLQSSDGGESWRSMKSTPVTMPVVADEGGPADRITHDDEFEAHTWLSSFFARGNKAHFLYLAQTTPPRQHYMRFDIATATRELDLQPDFKGETLALRNLDGFFATKGLDPNAPIYVTSRDTPANRLACLVSHDSGTTWRDYAVSPEVSNLYAIGGLREVTPDGWVLGSFTEQLGPTTDPGGGSKVHFFRFRACDP
jgi:hypothetical protein